jgi:hypothetical protein
MKSYFRKLADLTGVISDIRASRLSSFPFISGDGFRSFCDLIIESFEDIPGLEKKINIRLLNNDDIKIFVKLSLVENHLGRAILINEFKKINICDTGKIKIIFHNGDKIPDINFFNQLKNFGKLYSVNVNDSFDSVCGIPIGIENYHHMNNGLMKDFIAFKHQKLEALARDVIVFNSFNLKTNLLERLRVKNEALDCGFEFHGSDLPRKKYLNYLQRSFFITSPAGNGPDCHRTWEALLMGAVPVVMRNTLSRSVVENSPILEIESWHDFFSLTKNEMKSIYHQKLNQSLEKCTLQYWMNIINGNTN